MRILTSRGSQPQLAKINIFKDKPLEIRYMKICTTTNEEVTSKYVEFKCPKCLGSNIIRSSHARETSMPYICPECGFTGP